MFQRLLDADEFFMGAEEEEEEENRFAMFRPTQTQHNNIPGIYYIIYIYRCSLPGPSTLHQLTPLSA